MNFYYSYDTNLDSIVGTAASTILSVVSVAMAIWGVCWIAGYILRGFGLYTIAKDQGDANAWMAFVPFARQYQQGALAGDITIKKKTIRKTGILFLVLPIAWGIVSYLISMVCSMSVAGKLIKYGIFAVQGQKFFDLEDIIEPLMGFFLIYALLMLVYKAVYNVLQILIDMQILSKYTEGNMPVIHSVLSVFVPLYESICFFVISRKIGAKSEEEYTGYQETSGYTYAEENAGYHETSGYTYVEENMDQEAVHDVSEKEIKE